MTHAPPTLQAPEWLRPLQRAFSTTLRTPLAVQGRRLEANPARFVALDGRASERALRQLAMYNRQYWFRLFGVLHREYRLATALLGPFRMNLLGSALWSATAPTGHDLAAAADGLCDHVARAPWPDAWPVREAVLQALAIDDAHREAFRAPAQTAWQPSAADEAALTTGRLVATRSWRIVEESWPLVALRSGLGAQPAEHAIALPAPLSGGPRSWLVWRIEGEGRIACMTLEPAQARLYTLLCERRLTEALAQLDAETHGERGLEAKVRDWLANSMQLGLWAAVVPT